MVNEDGKMVEAFDEAHFTAHDSLLKKSHGKDRWRIQVGNRITQENAARI